MAVPNTNTFSLQDVVDEVNPTTDDLVDCFAYAVASKFDSTYEGSKDRLSNFRNYDSDSLTQFTASSFFLNAGSNQCSNTPSFVAFFHDGNGSGPDYGDTVYRSDGISFDANVYRKYFPPNLVEIPYTFGTDSNGVVVYKLNCVLSN